jgi:hypothetical protein
MKYLRNYSKKKSKKKNIRTCLNNSHLKFVQYAIPQKKNPISPLMSKEILAYPQPLTNIPAKITLITPILIEFFTMTLTNMNSRRKKPLI